MKLNIKNCVKGKKKATLLSAALLSLAGASCTTCSETIPEAPAQVEIPLMKRMPNFPKPYNMRDWNKVAHGADELIYDLDAKGEFLPITRLLQPEENQNSKSLGFGFTPFIGPHEKNKRSFEAIAMIGNVLSATYAGIDKSKQDYNWVEMCEQFYNKNHGRDLFLNNIKVKHIESFWYSVFPNILFYSLTDRYPGVGNNETMMRTTADSWYDAAYIMGGSPDKTGFDYTCFDFKNMKPHNNKIWIEPDGAAGIGWLQYAAYLKFGDQKYLDAAKWCFEAMDDRLMVENPYYEVMLPFGVYAAARMNAEQGTNYDVNKFMNWCFEHSSKVRPDMGVIHDTWLDHDCHGLVGSINTPPWRKTEGGYAFAMNTFAMASPLVAMVRYDDRYATSIAKWMLNAGNAARLFYPNAHPNERQTSPDWEYDKENVIAFEGLRQNWYKDEKLLAGGDAVKLKWGYDSDLGLYGSSYAGVFGGIIRTTNQKYILQLNCLATEYAAKDAYPTYLYYNPYTETKDVELELPEGNYDIYEMTRNKFMAKGVSGKTQLTIPAHESIMVVLAPAGGKVSRDGNKVLINNIVVDYK